MDLLFKLTGFMSMSISRLLLGLTPITVLVLAYLRIFRGLDWFSLWEILAIYVGFRPIAYILFVAEDEESTLEEINLGNYPRQWQVLYCEANCVG